MSSWPGPSFLQTIAMRPLTLPEATQHVRLSPDGLFSLWFAKPSERGTQRLAEWGREKWRERVTERQRQCDGERSQEAKQLTASLPLLSLVPPGFSCLSLAAPYQGPLVHCSCFAGHRAELMPRGIEKISASKPSMDRLERESLLRRTQQAPYGQKSSSLELSGGPVLIKPWPVGNCPDIKPRLSDMSQGIV